MNATATAAAPQHMRALAQANRVRLARAELKRQVTDGELTVEEIVLACPWEAESMSIADLLMSQHRWGHPTQRRRQGREGRRLLPRQRRGLGTGGTARQPAAGVKPGARVAISTMWPSGSRR